MKRAASLTGFCSIEVDVFALATGEVLVGHNLRDLRPARSIQVHLPAFTHALVVESSPAL